MSEGINKTEVGPSGIAEETPKTPGAQLKDLQRRFEAGEDVSEEASTMLFELVAHQSQRIEAGVSLSDIDFKDEQKFHDELEALVFIK